MEHQRKKEFSGRIADSDPSTLPLGDLATIIRTQEAVERTRLARVRTNISFIILGLAAAGFLLLFFQVRIHNVW